MGVGQRAVVFGGLGFIGSNLAIQLAEQGWSVVAVDIDSSSIEAKARLDDVLRVADVLEAGIEDTARIAGFVTTADVVFDLAGSTGHLASMVDPENDLLANLVKHVHYLEVLRSSNRHVPVISASTRQVIGKATADLVDEWTEPVPVDVNGVSKLAWEQYLRVMGSTWGLPSVSVRLPNVYGPRMRIRDSEHGVIGSWVGQALQGSAITVFGAAANQQRNVLHVLDACTALVGAVPLASAASLPYFVGGEARSLEYIARVIGDEGGVAVESLAMPDELAAIQVGSLVVNDARFKAASSWAPVVGFREGIRQSLDFFREFGARYAI
jgi:UDP-glucose 4-epimerase